MKDERNLTPEQATAYRDAVEDTISRGPSKQRPGDQPLPRPDAITEHSVQAYFRHRFATSLPKGIIDYSHERERIGVERYGQALYPFNGRNAAQDAFEECFDLIMYLMQMRMEGIEIEELSPVIDLLDFLWEHVGPPTDIQ